MTTKKVGRPKKKDKVKNVSAYLSDAERRKVEKKYTSVTNALRIEVLPKCG